MTTPENKKNSNQQNNQHRKEKQKEKGKDKKDGKQNQTQKKIKAKPIQVKMGGDLKVYDKVKSKTIFYPLSKGGLQNENKW